jgi:glutamyl-tRNA reductase
VQLFNLDDVERFVKRNLELRHSEVQKAEAIIHSYLQV